ncbi:hypothetical protein BASA60_002716 [Batrachochytrium salamandrivorans]|nr:hypothetical protein BASA62_002605 [Batrachochytrium salamandrivorans]KAH6580849.1 hypothetical protein BASA60_002716 [Batrachochytrium salamandrivorans]KAH9271007.1 hypothetical protein BASA83_006759 [Batrachochytrium salamandrivorans]
METTNDRLSEAALIAPIRLSNYISGQFKEPSTQHYIESPNPATGLTHALVPDSAAVDVDDAVAAAKAAFPEWSATPRSKRSALLMRIADLLEQRLDAFAIQESRDQGKPISLATSIDIPRAIHNFRFFATSILHQQESTSVLDGVALSYVHRSAVGVAGLISPWNLPLYLLTWKIAEITSVTAWMLCSILQEAGLPAGVVNMVFGTGPAVGAPLVAHKDVPLISFTGGTSTGEIIYKAASALNKKLSLELGGKNANIVFSDADFEDAVSTSIRSSFANQGEICLCGSRIFVHEDIFDRFVAELAKRTDALIVGDPALPTTQVGALVSKEHMEKVMSYVSIAKQEGGKIIAGGNRELSNGLAAGCFFRPTVITGVHPCDARVQQEEIFGPIVTVSPFKTDEEAISYANSTKYGLSASVWTQNVKRAHTIGQKLHVGTVWINCWMVRDLNMPFGGMKMSGLGREGRHHSMDFFCEETTVCVKL